MYDEQDRRALKQIAVRNIQRLSKSDRLSVGLSLKLSRYNIAVGLAGGDALLFNSASRALCKLNQVEYLQYKQWQSGEPVEIASQRIFVTTLKSDGFLVQQNVDELDQTEQQYFGARRDKTSMLLTVAPTMACNLACGYCFQGLDKDLKKMDKTVPDAIVDMVKYFKAGLSSLTTTWYGGEPLMSRKEIHSLADRLIALCDMQGITYNSSIVTNGYFLTPDVAMELYTRRCTTAQITIDGLKETHDKMRPMTSGRGSYDVIIKNLNDVLQETPMAIVVRVNVGKDNLHECDVLLDEFQTLGFAESGKFELYFAPIDASTPESGSAFEEGLSKQEFNDAVLKLSERARSLGLASPIAANAGFSGMCVAAKDLGYVVGPTGDIHKCWETAHDATRRIGTVFEPENLEYSLNSKLWSNWSPFDSDICSDCKILPMCGGFCAHRFVYQGVGDEHSLPCPEWKWNTAEFIFSRAKSLGQVTDEDWLESETTIQTEVSGKRHTPESLRAAQSAVLTHVNKERAHPVDRDFVISGDGRRYEEEDRPQPVKMML